MRLELWDGTSVGPGNATCALRLRSPAMTGYFGRSDMTGGIVAGIQRLQAAVDPVAGESSAATFPDLIEDV